VTSTPHSHQQISHPHRKINKETSELIDTLDQMDLTDIYRIFDSAHYISFSTTHGTFSQIDNLLEHKEVLTNIRKSK
jgi:hypothetical protein